MICYFFKEDESQDMKTNKTYCNKDRNEYQGEEQGNVEGKL